MTQSQQTRYGAVAQTFHWITAIVVLVAFLYGPGGSEQQIYLPGRDFDRQLHESLGLCVFFLTIFRLLWRMFATPHIALPLPRWVEIASKTLQAALYLLLFAVPLTAISGAWLEGHSLTLLAGFKVASPIAMSHDLGVKIAGIHTWLGDAILWLAGAHALAAIFHRVVLKDGVLSSMLPRWVPFQGSKGDI
jgi:cytochrome b561